MQNNKKRSFKIFASLLILFLNLGIQLRANSYSFKNVSISEGLSHRAINCILQDQKGFVWIGTSDGLNRFDGYTFKQFFNDPTDSLSIGTNNITGLTQDTLGTLWISTDNGFYNYIPETEAFYKITINKNSIKRVAEGICIDDDGNIWGVENSNTIIKMQAGSKYGEYIYLDSILGLKEQLYNKKIFWADGYLWIFNSKGIVQYDYKNNKAKIVASEKVFFSARTLRGGKKGEVLVVDWTNGVYSLNTQTLEMRPFILPQLISGSHETMGITDIHYNKDGSVWVIGFPGLFKMLPNGDIIRFNKTTGYEANFDQKVYFTTMMDSQGNFWLGSQDEGLFVISPQSGISKHYSIINEYHTELQSLRFLIDNEDLFICNLQGTFYSSNKSDWEKGIFTKLTSSISQSISKINDDEFYIFTKNRVVSFNKKTNQLKTIFETSDLQNGIVDSKGVIWVTHWEQGIEGFDPKTNKSYQIDVDTIDKSSNVVFTLIEDEDGSLWLGTFGAGLHNIKNPTSDNLTRKIYKNNDSSNSLSNNLILSLHKDKKNNIWIGTNGGGLNKLNINTGLFETYNTSNGLKSNVIQSITSDNDGNIWLATSNISKIDIKTKKITHYGINDGIRSKYFNLQAQTTPDGILYFADNRGILSINPNDTTLAKKTPQPLLTSVKLFGVKVETRQIFNEIVPFPKSITYSNSIVLPHNLNSITLEFGSIEPSEQKNLLYKYILEGINEQWITTSSRERTATYTILPPGKYVFRVKSSTGKDNWSEEKVLAIIIKPAWWQTWWFKFSIIALFIISILVFINVRIRNIKKRSFELETTIQKRTRELVLTNDALREKQIVIEMKNNQLNEVLVSKNQLISILAHDFKNPLNGMIGIASMIERENEIIKNIKLKKLISTIVNSAYSLSAQMVKVLDWIRSQDTKMEASPIEINLELLINDVITLEKGNATKKDISIELETNYVSNAFVDPLMISTVFRNILTNAIKFTERAGAITILIEETENNINTSIIDTGIGISNELKEKILNTNSTLEPQFGTDNEKGSGLGLHLCKNFIEKNKGKLDITNNLDKGSIFSISLPKGKTKSNKRTLEKNVENYAPTLSNDEKSGHTILVIDDNIEILEAIIECFGNEFEIFKAHDGNEGYIIAREVIPDIIISDINMPVKNGLELCSLIKEDLMTNHIPVLLMSSHFDDVVKQQAYENGANDFIEKPFNPHYIKRKVEALIEYKKNLVEKSDYDPDNSLPNPHDDVMIMNVLKLIEDNISNKDLSANFIADEIGVSRSQMWRLFKKHTGKSIGDFIREKKLQKASSMLMSGKYRIGEVSDFIGFSDSRYFSRLFQKEYGISPSEYTKKFKKN